MGTQLIREPNKNKRHVVVLCLDLANAKVSSASIEMRTGRKWKAGRAVVLAESLLRKKALVGRAHLGYFPKPLVSWVSFLAQAIYNFLPIPTNQVRVYYVVRPETPNHNRIHH